MSAAGAPAAGTGVAGSAAGAAGAAGASAAGASGAAAAGAAAADAPAGGQGGTESAAGASGEVGAAGTTAGTSGAAGAAGTPAVATVATLYWLDITGNRVMRSDEQDFSAGAPIARTNTAPDGVAVDVAGGKVYWSNMGSLLGTGGGTLQRANLDGSDVETIVPSGIARTPKQIQLDVENRHVYWCDREGAKLWRVAMDGGTPEVLVSGHGLQQLVGVALDVPGRQVYFSDRIGMKIYRAGFDMPAGEDDASRADVEELFTFAPGAMPIDLDLDLDTGMLYWTDRQLGTVNRAPMGGGDVETLVTGLADTIGISVDVAAGKLYYSELGGRVWQAGLDGSGARMIASSGSATGVALVYLPAQ